MIDNTPPGNKAKEKKKKKKKMAHEYKFARRRDSRDCDDSHRTSRKC